MNQEDTYGEEAMHLPSRRKDSLVQELVDALQMQRERAERAEARLAKVVEALERVVAILVAHSRRYPGSLHSADVWCDCGYCDARAALAAARGEGGKCYLVR